MYVDSVNVKVTIVVVGDCNFQNIDLGQNLLGTSKRVL